MLRNYILIALRSLKNNKVFTLINLLGLAVGMSASILLLLWVQDELSVDNFHTNSQQLYRVVAQWKMSNETKHYPSTPAPLATTLQRDIPGIDKVSRFSSIGRALLAYQTNVFDEKKGALVDPSFLQMFTFPLLKGNMHTALTNPHSILLSESLAAKYFGTEDPVGKIIRINNKHDLTVTGILQNVPANSHLSFDFLMPFVYLKERGTDLENNWDDYNYITYAQLSPGASVAAVNRQVGTVLKRRDPQNDGLLYLQALPAIYLDKTVEGNGEAHGNLQYVYVFSAIGLFILLLACINYTNLSTARSAKRAKEVGLRKVAGAYRGQLIGQFLSESFLMVSMALLIALALVWLLLPIYNNLTGKQLTVNLLTGQTLLTLMLVALTTGLVAGSYPALMLSGLQPVKVLKGVFKAGKAGITLRKGLVVVQFTLSILMIASTLIVSRQLHYIRSKSVGYDKENVLSFSLRGNLDAQYEAFRDELARQPSVGNVTSASSDLNDVNSSSSGGEWEGKAPNVNIILNQLSVDRNFTQTFGIPMLVGRGFSSAMKTDSNAFILNEEAVRQMGLQHPVGKRLTLHDVTGPIIGVAKNFHFRSLHESIGPMVLFVSPNWRSRVYVKANAGSAEAVVAATQKVWKAFNPDYPFEYQFIDESFDRLYRADQRTGQLFNYFSFIAVFIACLGLFGLAAYTAEQRTKEIGVRKVLGASVSSIITLLSGEYLKLVLIALLIATPIGWYAMSQWLTEFAYRINIDWWIFPLAGMLAMVVALLTVGTQSVKAALINPIESLQVD
ncbi:ABC transporter permease [uncultured Fibrella sp.]|uniref:ABC transporter permease n=1 Tax=uncultured Fibrella sp. TaxID=1284596 RepID=UPI0035CB1325